MRDGSANTFVEATALDWTDPESLPLRSADPDALPNTAPLPGGSSQDTELPNQSDSSPALPFGGNIKHYEFIREIGRGGMGAVYLARDTLLGRLVAIKLLAKHNPVVVKRFVAEARATARCSHENIVVIHEIGEHQGHPYMVLQYLEGQTLRAWMKERATSSDAGPRPVSVHSAVELMIPVVRALVCAHQEDIVHRDLKPENILLTSSGSVKVLDFGIAKLLSGPDIEPALHHTTGNSLHLTNPGALLGTLPYMSPEQLKGGDVDHRSDIWAAGIMLHELVLGSHPLAPLTKAKLARMAKTDEPIPSVRAKAPELGPLGAIIDRCLIKNKADRTSSARALLVELEALVPTKRAATSGAGSTPFAGLAAFQETDAARFFGREREITSTVAQLRRQPLVALVGPSGAGKSSLVRAGVIPALKRSGEGWDAFITRPGRQPLTALATVIDDVLSMRTSLGSRGTNRTAAGMESGEHEHTGSERLQAEPGYLGVELRAYASTKRRRVLVFVDQFEELYTLGADADERNAFIACLEAAADDPTSPVRVILSMRSDFLDRMAEDGALTAEISRGLTFLSPMTRDGLREALIRPVEAAEHRFESPALVARMLDALESRRGALPLLQFTASMLWELRDRERRLLTEESYQAVGGVAGALASHADTVLAGMTAPQQALARKIFQRLVTPERTRAIVSMDELRELAQMSSQMSVKASGNAGERPQDSGAGEIERVVQHLAAMRLLVIESGDDAGGSGRGNLIELVHESLIDGWPTLARWLDEDQENAVFLARLRSAAKEWEASGRAEGMLWRDQPARDARDWYSRYRGELGQRERAYLDAVVSLTYRTARIKRITIAGIISVLIALLVAAAVALVWIRSAEQRATLRAEELRTTSEGLRTITKKLEQSLTSEKAQTEAAKRAQGEAEAARREAEAAKRRAEDEAARAQKALADAHSARNQAQLSAAQAKAEKKKAKRAAKKAEQAARKADEAAKKTAESEEKKQQIIERAIGPIEDKL